MHRRFPLAPLLALVLAACSPSNGSEKKGGHPGMGMPPPEVLTTTVAAQSLPLGFEYVGQTAGSREVEVRARVPGIILKRNFTEGAPVKEGQSLYTIDPAQLEAAAARAEADVVAAQARLEQAKRNAARLKPLYAEKAVSQKENDDAVSAEEISAADLKAARARLIEAKLSLSYTKVEAPVSGVASRSLRSEGSLVGGPETLLTTVVQVDPIWVNFGIPDNEQARLQKERRCHLTLIAETSEGYHNLVRLVSAGYLDGYWYRPRVDLDQLAAHSRGIIALSGCLSGRVCRSLLDGDERGDGRRGTPALRVSPTTGTREARAELPNPKGVLRPGEFVRVILRGATRPNALTVPQRAVMEGPQGKFVYIVDENNTAQPRPIEVGEWAGDAWIINKGVQPGDRVIVEGLMRLGPGAPVRIAEAGSKPALVAALRTALYTPLAEVANRWNAAMGIDVRYPAEHEAYIERCHKAGQTKATPLMLQYSEGDYNCLHQDLYGEHVFPLQVTFLLSEAGHDFTGGEFVLTEQRPRMQSRAEVLTLERGGGVIFPVRHRPVKGSRGIYRVNTRHGVSRVRSGHRYTLGIIFHDAQ